MNHMLCCHLVSDKDKKDAMVIRIFVSGAQGVIMDREMEILAIQVAAQINVGQPVYALFKNGIVYKYAAGRTLNAKDVQNPQVMRQATFTLYQIIKLDNEKLRTFL